MPAPAHKQTRLRRALRLVGWNALLCIAGAALIAIAGEAWLRLTKPFMETSLPPRIFVPKTGILWKPDTEMRLTNRFDYWVVSRVNSLGFFDREPLSPPPPPTNKTRQAAASPSSAIPSSRGCKSPCP